VGIRQELGEKIKRMRQNRGMTQEQLSEAVDISQRALSAIERGENFVTSDTLDKLLTVLDTTSEELFALNHIKPSKELLGEIIENLRKIAQNQQKLELIYNITRSLLKE